MIEVIVSLAILSLVMLATVSGLRTLAATQGSLEAVTERNDALRSASSFLRNALDAAVQGSDSGGLSLGGGISEQTFFEVRDGALFWETVMLIGESYGGSYLVRVAGEDQKLVLRWIAERPTDREIDWNRAPARTLVNNLDSFEVAYRREPDGEWLERWDARGTPGWVRLRIQSRDRYWPDLIAAVAR